MQEAQFFLTDIWYHAFPSAALAKGQMRREELLGEPILFLRAADGTLSALRNVCPHRGIPLSYGTFDGQEVECCYHGWRFNLQGTCTCIPSLVGGEGVAVDKIKVRRFAVHEENGQVWIFMGDAAKANTALVPSLPACSGAPRCTEIQIFPSHIDHAVIGLMDPAHGPFVHQSWWWRKKTSIRAKAKQFGPALFGFAMLRHQPSSNSVAYKILGGRPTTEIRFHLPGVRVEEIEVGTKRVVNLTTVTPINATTTRVTNVLYWNMGWLSVLKPIIKYFQRTFLGQDRRVVVWQQEGLQHEKNLLLIKDADTQARWYYQLKNEYQRAQAEQREFINPVKPVTLQWRS